MTHLSTTVEIAAELRRRAGLKCPPFSTTAIINTCFPRALVTGAQLKPGFDEIVSRLPDGPIIVYSRALPIPQQRVAIAHALAHLIFDDASSRMRPGCAGVPACEARADCFAADLLVPLDELRRVVQLWPSEGEEHEIYLDHVDELGSRFVAPAEVIDSQIRRLGVTRTFVSQIG